RPMVVKEMPVPAPSVGRPMVVKEMPVPAPSIAREPVVLPQPVQSSGIPVHQVPPGYAPGPGEPMIDPLAATPGYTPTRTTLRPIALMQKGEVDRKLPADESQEYSIQLEPPGPQRLFKLESEAAFFERLRQEARQRPTPERIEFPAEPVLSTQQV